MNDAKCLAEKLEKLKYLEKITNEYMTAKNPLISNVLRTFAISAFSDAINVDRQSYF